MSIAYVRDTYGLPWVKRGLRVIVQGHEGVITSATHYLWVRKDGERHARPYHPTDVHPKDSSK